MLLWLKDDKYHTEEDPSSAAKWNGVEVLRLKDRFSECISCSINNFQALKACRYTFSEPENRAREEDGCLGWMPQPCGFYVIFNAFKVKR